MSLFAADKYVNNLKKLIQKAGDDVSMDIELQKDVLIGKDFAVKAKLKKTCPVGESRKLSLSITCNTTYYTGVRAKMVFQDMSSVAITGAETCKFWAY